MIKKFEQFDADPYNEEIWNEEHINSNNIEDIDFEPLKIMCEEYINRLNDGDIGEFESEDIFIEIGTKAIELFYHPNIINDITYR